MYNLLTTLSVLLIGFFIMVTGFIEWLFLGFLVWLGLCLIAEIINIVRKEQIAKKRIRFLG